MHHIPSLHFFSKFHRLLILLTTVGLLHAAPAESADCHVYGVNLQGVATVGDATAISGSEQFSVGEYAILRNEGVVAHPVEFYLTPNQDLNASGLVGQIELMTNSGFARNLGIASARFDLASIATSSNGFTFQMDSGMSFQLPSPNVFLSPGIGSVPGGLGGLGFLPGGLGQIINSAPVLSISYFVPRNGSGSFYTPDGAWATIAGELNLVGTGIDNANFQGQYQATFSGQYLGSFDC